MADFCIGEMMELQQLLQEQYQHKWKPLSPEIANYKLLYMIGELGEVIDILKKNGADTAAGTEQLRADLTEEMADVLMYYVEVLMCLGITPEELKKSYREKFERNMNRW